MMPKGDEQLQESKEQTSYFFVDESGDTTFFDKHGNFIVGQEGCSKILLLGFVKTKKPEDIRTALKELRTSLINDPYLEETPSMKKTAIAFHAKDDCPEVRQALYKLLPELDFTSQIVVARKTKNVIEKFQGNANRLYDYLITQLFRNVLHKASLNKIYFATRGNRKRQEPLNAAILNAIGLFENQWKTKVNAVHEIYPQSPSGEPCLQVIDYINWAIYRAYTKGEMRYFNAINDKVRLLVDLYDYKDNWGNFYTQRNPFHIKKISPL